MATITSADSTFSLTIQTLFPSPVQVQGYSVDAMFESDAIDNSEIQYGADGVMVAGFVYAEMPMTVTLLASSSSGFLFEQWAQGNRAARATYRADGVITSPGLGREYTLTNGYLRRYMPFPSARKVYQPRAFTITWQDISGAPI